MSLIYRCDRCLKETSVAWEIKATAMGMFPESQYIPPKSFDLCGTCAMSLDRFKEGFPVEAGRKRD